MLRASCVILVPASYGSEKCTFASFVFDREAACRHVFVDCVHEYSYPWYDRLVVVSGHHPQRVVDEVDVCIERRVLRGESVCGSGRGWSPCELVLV